MNFKPFCLLACLALPSFAQMGGGMGGFGGPAVLGRGAGAGTGQRGGADMGFSIFAGVMGTYDSGLTGLALDAEGNAGGASLMGLDVTFGITGRKSIRRGQLGVMYNSHYRHYAGGGFSTLNRANNFNGIDQSLGLFASRTLSRRSSVSTNIMGLTTNRGIGAGMMMPGLVQNQTNFLTPVGEIFDNRIYFASGTGEYNFQKSARLSFGFSGTGMITRRTSGLLFGVNGAFAGANAAYRLTRRQTISAGYQFLTFNFTRNFGDTFGHGVVVGHSLQLGRRAQLATQVGVMRVESLSLRTESVDPVIASLRGISNTSEGFYSKVWIPTFNASLNYRVNRLHSFSINGMYGVGPGNGVVNAARMVSAGSMYSYSGIRNLGRTAGISYNRISGLIGANQTFSNLQVMGSANRRLTSTLFSTISFGQRKFLNSGTNSFARNSLFVTGGINWSPSAIPVSIR